MTVTSLVTDWESVTLCDSVTLSLILFLWAQPRVLVCGAYGGGIIPGIGCTYREGGSPEDLFSEIAPALAATDWERLVLI
jgi:hypothetical protein